MKSITLFILAIFLSLTTYSQAPPAVKAFNVTVSGEGQPMILIPGLASSGAVWSETVKQLSSEYQCHILTLAGFAGQQPLVNANSSFLETMKTAIIDYIKTEHLERPIIMGHSLGGFLALSISISEPDLLEKVIILDAYPFYTAAMNPMATMDQAKQQGKMMKDLMTNQSDSMFQVQQEYMMATMATSPEHVSQIVEWSLASDRATIGNALYELMTTDLRGEVSKAKCPILVLGAWYAAKDYGLTADIVRTMFEAQYGPGENINIEMAATAKHFIMLDEAAWFYQTIQQFLK